jgi:hypothetical protein
MAPALTDGSVQTDDLTVVRDFPDGNATGIPDPALGDAAYGGQYHTGCNVLFAAQFFYGQHQVITTAQPDAVTGEISRCG